MSMGQRNEHERQHDTGKSPEFLSDANIEAYVEGCGLIAYDLHFAIEAARKAGKKPTIVIPSRGSLPIYLVALAMLPQITGSFDSPLFDKSKTNYYPHGIFNWLSNGMIQENGNQTSEIDVVLYPFTADVNNEAGSENAEDEAKKFRKSATRGLLALLDRNNPEQLGQRDRAWQEFLISKLQPDQKFDSTTHTRVFDPKAILDSLQSIAQDPTPLDKRQIILIDTVISGRASSHIIPEFDEQGHKVIAILAADKKRNENEAKYKTMKYMREVQQHWVWGPSQIEEFPLISEDTGAALLGVSAVNIDNFNDPAIFEREGISDFQPQSCIWTLPPEGMRQEYKTAFHAFLRRCIEGNYDGWNKAKLAIAATIDKFHKKGTQTPNGELPPAVANSFLQGTQVLSGRDTSSGIVSLHLGENVARQWVADFVKQLPNSTRR